VADSSNGAWIPTPAETTFDNGITTSTTGWKNNSGQLVQWINDSAEIVSWSNNYNGKTTTFDATSMRFEAPVDMYSDTDAYDKYLVFPRKTILG
jgi:alpha-amylase/alpha-mannosidase (GH57 family)